MSTNRDRTASTDRGPQSEPPSETVVAARTEDGVVLYDEENPDAWITSTVELDLSDAC